MDIVAKYEQIIKKQCSPAICSAQIPYTELRKLLSLARVGQAVLAQKDELEHIDNCHGIYVVKTILEIIKEREINV